MGGDHHHHGPPYVVPDYKVFKVEECPELMEVKRKLAAKGLSDPWLRNEVWRFHPNNFNSIGKNIRVALSRGLGVGLVAFGLTIAYESLTKEEGHGHGHGDHH